MRKPGHRYARQYSLRASSIVTILMAVMVAAPFRARADDIALPSLRAELLTRADVDQSLRKEIDFATTEKSKEWQRLRVVDRADTERMRKLVAVHGWLTGAMVGRDGVDAAWLLVQHAAADPAFQLHCLTLIEAMPPGEVSGESRALLTDRVLLARGSKQRYGSQVQGDCVQGLQGAPIEDPGHVDDRRATLGMESLASYLDIVKTLYCTAQTQP